MTEVRGREILPIPDQPYTGKVFEDAKDPEAIFPPIEPLRPPAGAPNVLIVLIDDAGFAASSAFYVEGDTPVPAGRHQVRMEFAYDGGGLGKGAIVSLYVDGQKTGDGRIEASVPMVFSADETCDVGSDTASPVSDDYTAAGSRFTGTIEWVQIDIDDAAEDLDHLISPEERLRIAMARQ